MKEQNKSPLNFQMAAMSAYKDFDGGGGLAGLLRHITAKRDAPATNTAEAMPQNPSSGGVVPAGVQALGAQAPTPAPTAIGPASGGNPFEGKTFTISPAQMRNVKNVFGDKDERQASVGQSTGQGSENYDTYEEESPLTKKSCGSYKK